MESFDFLWQIFVFLIRTFIDKLANVADEAMFIIEDYEVYGKIIKLLSSCLGSYYFWQLVSTVGFYQYLRRLAEKFPRPPIIEADIGPSMEQLLEEKETALQEAASKINDFDMKNVILRAKVDRLEKEVDFISKDRYTLVKEKCILQNKLGDFNSWPEFRVEYDQLATEFEAMKRQRVREHISHEQILHVAKEAKLNLAAAKRTEAMSKIAHSEELKQVQQERDEAQEKYQHLLATATAATPAVTTHVVATPAVATTATTTAKDKSPGDKALQEENTRLTIALRSQTSLLTKKSSDLTRMQSLLKTRSDHSAAQLTTAASTIRSLEKEKKKADERVAELEKDLQEANEKAEEMEGMYLAVAFADEGEGGMEGEDEEMEGEDEEMEEGEVEDEEENGEGRPETSWLLKQVVAMIKKRNDEGATSGGSGADEAGSEEDDDDDDKQDDNEEEEHGGNEENEEDEEDKEGEEERVQNENEDLFKDMMGSP